MADVKVNDEKTSPTVVSKSETKKDAPPSRAPSSSTTTQRLGALGFAALASLLALAFFRRHTDLSSLPDSYAVCTEEAIYTVDSASPNAACIAVRAGEILGTGHLGEHSDWYTARF
jgi:hypothetical protein